MQRIGTENREVDKFGAGKDGFAASVPGVRAATYLSADFLNGVQESMVRVIERAGLTPSESMEQFADAVEGVTAMQAGLAISAAVAAETARDAALLSRGVFATTVKALSKGVVSVTSLVAGSGGTNGTFALAFSGGAGVDAAGVFVVAGGALVSVTITSHGDGYTSAPALAFTASAGLTGASATAVISNNVDLNEYFTIPSGVAAESFLLYKNVAGVATLQKTFAASDAVSKPSWAGKVNGWPDPFFRRTVLSTTSMFGADRWFGVLTNWSIVTGNPVFNGNVLRRAPGVGQVPLSGPAINLADINAVAGDTITVYVLAVGDGAVVRAPGRFAIDSADVNVGGQVQPVDAAGASNFISSATPQWLRHEQVVPATAGRFYLYPYTDTASKGFDIVALWACKGAASTVPSWPSLDDTIYSAWRDTVDLADQTSAVAVKSAVDYAVLSTTKIGSSALSVVAAASAVSTLPHDAEFYGWCENFTPGGISFNAIRIPQISQTVTTEASKWRELHLMIRTSATPFASGAVVAIATARINPADAEQAGIVFLLKHPTTGAVVTLTNADFVTSYIVGVYAKNAAGGKAACGEPRGTTVGNGGQCGYFTALNSGIPTTGTWSQPGGANNIRMAFEHLMLTGPVDGLDYAPTPELSDSLSAGGGGALDLVLPSTIYGVQNAECNLYFDNVMLGNGAEYDYLLSSAVAGTKRQYSERFYWLPSGAVATGTMTFSVLPKNSETVLASGIVNLRAAALTAGNGTTKKWLQIGDSITNAGVITQTLLEPPTGDTMLVELLGTRGTGANKHEGRPGWKVSNYATFFSDGTYGVNPFWISGALNFPQYLTNNSIAVPDWVGIQLGTNDVFNATSDLNAQTTATDAFINLDLLITSIKAAGANVKVALMLPPLPSYHQDAFALSEAFGKTRARFKRNILIWAREMLLKYSGLEASRIYIVPSNTALDTVNNMSVAASAPVNSRSLVSNVRQNNSVHPATQGDQQIGDAVRAFLKYYQGVA